MYARLVIDLKYRRTISGYRLSTPLHAPPSEQATAREDQARKSSADAGAGDGTKAAAKLVGNRYVTPKHTA
jgi:hypothetical protein